MTKSIITALAIVACAAAAHAQSSQGSEDSLTGSLGLLGGSGQVLFVDVSSNTVASLAASTSLVGASLAVGSVYVVTTPSLDMSKASATNTSTGAKWIVTKTGHVLGAVFGESALVLQDPSTESRRGLDAAAHGIKITYGASKTAAQATNEYLTNRFGAGMGALSTGSGDLVTASTGDVVIAFQDSTGAVASAATATSATITYIGNGISTSTTESASHARYALMDMSEGNFQGSSNESGASVPAASTDLVTGGRK